MNRIGRRRRSRYALFSMVPLLLLALMLLGLTSKAKATDAKAAPALQDGLTISFRFGSNSVSEGGTASIIVEISDSPATTATVEYLTLDGTATSPGDYTRISPKKLTFTSSGSTTLNFSVVTKEDTIHEDDETINLILRNPVNASLGATSTAILTILDDDPATATPSSQATATPIFVDRFEPNNSLQEATTVQVNGASLCNITLWPAGDHDYFRFIGKQGLAYEVLTDDLDPGVDTVLTVYNTTGQEIGANDDYLFASRASRVIFSANVDGFYFARVSNTGAEVEADQVYCIEVNQVSGTATPTPRATNTRVPGPDACEDNSTFESACLIGADSTLDLNFVPSIGEGPDNDFFRLWVKPGILYTCETFDLSGVTDTNLILYDQNRNGIGGNDDKELGDFGSLLSWQSNYTGWLYILVGPHGTPEYASSYLYTYSLRCTSTVATPTSTPTSPPVVSGGAPRPPTPTPMPTSTPAESATPFVLVATSSPTPRPVVQIVPLPTNTPAAQIEQAVSLNLTVYYDENEDFRAELTEGVEDLAVAVYDNLTNELLAFGFTNEAGMIRFGSLAVGGSLRISIPFMQYNQLVTGTSNIFIRVAPMAPANPS